MCRRRWVKARLNGAACALGQRAGAVWWVLLLPMAITHGALAASPSLSVQLFTGSPPVEVQLERGDKQIPHSRLSASNGRVRQAWLAHGSARYGHAVLGDRVEATMLAVMLDDGQIHQYRLPSHRVFEDLHVRRGDFDRDGVDELVVVESDLSLGASLAVYGVSEKGIYFRARSAFIGQSNRWLNPIGSGDFDGDGHLELAVVRTPHLGGVLEIYRYREPQLELVASRGGYSTHTIGSTELELAAVVPRQDGDLILLPSQSHRRLALVALREQGLVQLVQVALATRITGALRPIGNGSFIFRGGDGRYLQATVSTGR